MKPAILTACLIVAVAAHADPGDADSASVSPDLGRNVLNYEPQKLSRPPFSYYLAAPDTSAIDTVRLVQLSSQPNDITDEEAWFERNDLVLPAWQVPNPFRGTEGNLPDWVPERFKDCIIVNAIRCPDAMFLVYGQDFSQGRYLLAIDTARGVIRYGYDLELFTLAPEYVVEDREFIRQALVWADERNGVLYLAHSHRTYATSSRGMNGYLTAVDPQARKILWRSRPLVCNSRNFEIVGDCIVAGYGFTAEPDYLYVLNRFTGAVLGRTKLKTAPDYIILRNDSLFVRCYDTDYIFRIVEGLR
jgi:hypothetical protein